MMGQAEDTHSHSKKEKQKGRKKSERSKVSLKSNGTSHTKSQGLRTMLFGSMTHLLDTLGRGWAFPSPQLCWVQSTPQLSQVGVEFLQLSQDGITNWWLYWSGAEGVAPSARLH